MPGRSFTSSVDKYKYGFNGKERDDEGLGGGNSTYDYGFRIYNPALGRFLSVDPLTKSYPWFTPYQFAANDPIRNIDVDGLEGGSAVEYMFTAIANDLESGWNDLTSSVRGFFSTSPKLPSTAPNATAPAIKPDLTLPAIKKTDETLVITGVKPGDPLAHMEVLPIAGDANKGRHGYTRKNGTQFHGGIDLKATPGTPVYAVADGTIVGPVVSSLVEGVPFRQPGNNENGAGNRLYLKSGSNKFGYFHLSAVGINPASGTTYKPGDVVKQGDVLGQTGSTGNANTPDSAGPHLHFQQTTNGQSVNPEAGLNTKFDSNGKAVPAAPQFQFVPTQGSSSGNMPSAVTTY